MIVSYFRITCLKQAFSLYQSYSSCNGCGCAQDKSKKTVSHLINNLIKNYPHGIRFFFSNSLFFNNEYSDFTTVCNSSVCLNTTSASDPSCSGNACPIVLLLVVDNEEQFVSRTGKCRLHITCKISTIGSCSKSLFNHHL